MFWIFFITCEVYIITDYEAISSMWAANQTDKPHNKILGIL